MMLVVCILFFSNADIKHNMQTVNGTLQTADHKWTVSSLMVCSSGTMLMHKPLIVCKCPLIVCTIFSRSV
eukprot:1021514-Amphidinium_carterae.1